MRRLLPLLALLTVATAGAMAEQATIAFGGERFVRAHQDIRGNGQQLVEFVRDGETLQTWQKLVGVHRFPAAGGDPKPMVGSLVRVMRQRYPDARYKILENASTGEVMIDFLVSAPGSEVVELNVFKYARHESGRGLIAIQFAQRFRLGEATGEQVASARQAAIGEAASFRLAGLD